MRLVLTALFSAVLFTGLWTALCLFRNHCHCHSDRHPVLPRGLHPCRHHQAAPRHLHQRQYHSLLTTENHSRPEKRKEEN